ncbi:MAG: transposase [Deltaproteobacteria bacterium]|nr:transposase [Deltaproteobacteria bacterium]
MYGCRAHGRETVGSVTERRTSVDWSLNIEDLLDNKYQDASKVVLVMDNLNTHAISSLYKTFPPEEALRHAYRLDSISPKAWRMVEHGRD